VGVCPISVRLPFPCRTVPHTVDLLDKRLDLGPLGLLALRHAAGDLRRVALNAGDEGVGEGVRLGAVVERRDDDALLAGIAATGDDDDTSDLEAAEKGIVSACSIQM
jgi:hypothetical protein